MSHRERFKSLTGLEEYELKNDGMKLYETKADLEALTVRIDIPSSVGSKYKSSPIFANE